MEKNITIWILTVLLVALGVACHDGDDILDNGGTEELKPIVLPANLRVEKITDLSAVLVWDGTSSEYEVEWDGEILSTQSISYGLEELTPEQTYSWKVRSKEGERYSEWVNGTDFTTLKFVDETIGWPGEWQGTDFVLDMTLLGMTVPVTTFLPDEVLQEKIEVKIEKKEGTIDKILFSSPRLQEILPELPEYVEGQVKEARMTVLTNVTDTIIADLDYPISIENLPEDIRDAVYGLIADIPLLGEFISDIKIEKVGIIFENLNLGGQLKEGNKIPVTFTIGGRFYLITDNNRINTALRLLPMSVSLDAGMTLYPKS